MSRTPDPGDAARGCGAARDGGGDAARVPRTPPGIAPFDRRALVAFTVGNVVLAALVIAGLASLPGVLATTVIASALVGPLLPAFFRQPDRRHDQPGRATGCRHAAAQGERAPGAGPAGAQTHAAAES